MSKLLLAVYSALLVFISPFALAESPTTEPALAFTFKDAQLKWGPCPAFIPKGCEIAVLHGDPGKTNADVFFKVPANFTIPSHWHTSPERMVLVSGSLQVTYEGQKHKPSRSAPMPTALQKCRTRRFAPRARLGILFIAFEAPVDAMPTESPAK